MPLVSAGDPADKAAVAWAACAVMMFLAGLPVRGGSQGR